jgi:hypothetical protein
MQPVTVSTTVDRPREEVFAFLDELGNHEAFTDHFLKDWTVLGADRARFRAQREVLELEVVGRRVPEGTVERTVGAGGRRVTRGTYHLTEEGPARTGVRFELAFERVPRRERLVAPLVRAWLRRVNQRAMDRLREVLAPAP